MFRKEEEVNKDCAEKPVGFSKDKKRILPCAAFLKGEYEILRQSIRDNYTKLNLHNIPEINCNYESVTNNCIKPFYSLQLIKPKGEIQEKNIIDLSLNPPSIVKKTKEENYKMYYMKDKVYTYELSNDNQYVTSKTKKLDTFYKTKKRRRY